MIAQIDAAYLKKRPSKLWPRLLAYSFFEGRPLTTKGRWINPLVFRLFALEKRLPVMRAVRKPIFVIGTGRSGTTILGIVLSMHRDVGFLNEPKALWHAVVSCEDVIGSYSHDDARFRLTEADASPQVVRDMHRLYSAYLLLSGSQRICDKYPELIFRVPFVRAIFPDAKFLFLVRNGWDTCRSIEHWSERLGVERGEEIHDWWGVDRRKWRMLVEQLLPEDRDLAPHSERIADLTRHADLAAVEWILTMREGMRIRDRYPDAVRTVSFEHLSNDPAGELDDLRRFCELDEDAAFTDYGSQTLRPVRAVARYELDQVIRPAFESVMQNLGYA